MTTQLHILRLCLLRFCLLGLLFDYGYYDYYSIIPITITIISMTRILTSFRDSVEVDTIRSFVPSFMIHKSMLSSCRGVWQQAHCTCVLEYMYTLHCMNNIIFRILEQFEHRVAICFLLLFVPHSFLRPFALFQLFPSDH